MRLRTIVLSVAASLVACTHGAQAPSSVSAPVPSKGKPAAPVSVSAELSAKSARVLLTFEAPAEGVDVVVSGIDGLVVEGQAEVIADGRFAKGDTRTFDVAFQPGAGRSSLVVSVAGKFAGGSRARVVAFGVGKGPVESPGEVTTTDDGARVRVLPAAKP